MMMLPRGKREAPLATKIIRHGKQARLDLTLAFVLGARVILDA
ncbi:MAG TPA: hypothetical protein VMU69_09450 [Bradyrhizobium sp.]|nr:hypothetical protein [Bradyrhizobium sp.]